MQSASQKAPSEMEKNCFKCCESIKNLNMIKCHLCDCMAHTKCIGWVRANLDFVNGQSNLLWLCNDCMHSVENLKANNSSDVAVAAITSVAESITCCMNDVRNELGQINTFIGSISDKFLASVTPANPLAARRNKRPRVVSPTETPRRPKILSDLMGGTKSAENCSNLVDTVPQPTEKCWIYLSRIAPHVTEDEITALIKECVPAAQPVVRKLVKKDADIRSFAFISFKVGIDIQLKEVALDAKNWPKGIYFRLFEERNSAKDFWGPNAPKLPRTIHGIQPTASDSTHATTLN